MGASTNELLRRTKVILSTPEGNRDVMLRTLRLQKDNRTKGASEALKWLESHQKCRKCEEIKEIEHFKSERAYYCNDCRAEGKAALFFSLPEAQGEQLEALAQERGITVRDMITEWVVGRLEEELAA